MYIWTMGTFHSLTNYGAVTCISWSSDSAIYLEDSWWSRIKPYDNISQWDTTFDLIFNVGHIYIWTMGTFHSLTSYGDQTLIALSHYDVDHEVKVIITCISWSSYSAIYLEDSWWRRIKPYDNISQWDTTFDLILNVGHYDLYSIVQWFCHISWRLYDGWASNVFKMSQWVTSFDLKINVGHFDLYFIVQWFCLISWRLFDE